MKKNIPLFKVSIPKNTHLKIKKIFDSGYIGQGKKVVEFENQLSKFLNNKKLFTLNSATSGLHMSYFMSSKDNNKNEIITTPMTCTATNTPIIREGFKPVWADVDPITGSISPNDIENKITKKTRAITMVHWGGNPCEIDRIIKIGKKYNIPIIEDSAHAFGSTFKGKKVGSGYADFSVFSFQAIKHLTTIDGGCVSLKKSKNLIYGNTLRWFGIDRTNKNRKIGLTEIDIETAGWKFHMNDVNATVGLEQIKTINSLISKHQKNAKFYNLNLDNKKILPVPENINGNSAYWLYTIHVANRDEFEIKMNKAGIATNRVHLRNDTHSCFSKYVSKLKNMDIYEKTYTCIPVGWWLKKNDLEYIVEKANKFAK